MSGNGLSKRKTERKKYSLARKSSSQVKSTSSRDGRLKEPLRLYGKRDTERDFRME